MLYVGRVCFFKNIKKKILYSEMLKLLDDCLSLVYLKVYPMQWPFLLSYVIKCITPGIY